MPPKRPLSAEEAAAGFEAIFRRQQSDGGGSARPLRAFDFDAAPADYQPDFAPETLPTSEPETEAATEPPPPASVQSELRPAPSSKSKTPKPHFHDHRERLRDKFARRGADAFDDYELLELILFQILPRVDTKPIAKRLIAEFGNMAEVVAAPQEKLTRVDGIGPKAARHLKLLHQVSVRIGRSSVINRPILSSWNTLLDYCRAAMQFEGREQFRVLFLDKKNRLLADEVLAQGTVDRAPVYPREIVRRALVHEATAIILAHNHPSGDPTPSPQDIELTNTIIDTVRAVNIVVHDHLIIGRDDVASFKMLGLM